jgi:hypothetical protein
VDLTLYTQYYRCKTSDRQLEIDECLRRNLNHPGISKVVLFREADAPPLPQASMPVEVVERNERITYSEWFRWVQRQDQGIGLLLNADMYLDEGLEHLAASLDSPDTFLALTRYNPGHAGFHLNDYPHWTQDVWGVRADAELPESLLYASAFPLGFPGCDNRIAYVMWSHGFRIRNPCYHVRSVHLQASTARHYDKTSDRLYGGVSYVHPSLSPDEDAELEFTLWTRSQQRPAGVLVNQQAIEQGVHQLRLSEAEVAQRFLDQQQFTGLAWVHEAVGSAHLEGDLHPFASEDTVFLPMPALLGDGVSLQLRQPARLEGLSVRLPRRTPAGYQLELQAEGEGEAKLVIEGDAAVALKPGGERRFWQPAELRAHSWSRLRLKLVGAAWDPAWRAEEGAELVLFGEEGSLSQAKSLSVIAEDTPPSPEPPAQPESKPASPAEPQPGPTPYSWRRTSECTALLEQGEELHRYGSRFRVLRCGDELVFDDRFWPSVGVSPLSELPCELGDRQGLFLWGFGQPTLELRPGFIANTKRFSADVNFWQYPCRTEGDAFAVHQSLVGPQVSDGVLQLYLGLPWATWIDRETWPTSTLKAAADRLRKLRQELQKLGLGLNVHSVCQHILWRENLHLLKAAGVDCIWLSHKSKGEDELEGVRLKAWHLYAVNAREANRKKSLIVKPVSNKPWLATFMGAYTNIYMTSSRLRLQDIKNEHRVHIDLKDEWHFHDIVYNEQALGSEVSSKEKSVNDKNVQRYNRLLSDSQFSLCPSGAGPNSLRLWESLAVGSIPVILSDRLEMPDLRDITNGRFTEWGDIVIFHPESEIETLLDRLRVIDRDEIETRTEACIVVSDFVGKFTCLGSSSDRAVALLPKKNLDLENTRPIITIPVYGGTDKYYWRHKKHGFYDMVIEWYLSGKVEIQFGDEGYFWWGREGEILLMERDLVIDMLDRKVDPPRWEGYVPYKYAFFFNQPYLRNSRNHIATYFTHHPKKLEHLRQKTGRKSWNQRRYKTIFAGSIENETQEFFRNKFRDWESSLDVFSCADRLNRKENHEYSQDEYLKLVSESLFGVCFRGNGPKCYRELECLALGTPLLITEGVCIKHAPPLQEGIHYIRINNPDELAKVAESIDEEKWDLMSRECWKWFSENATIDNIFASLATRISEFNLSEHRHSIIRIQAERVDAEASIAVRSLAIFDPKATWIDKNEPLECTLTINPNDLIVNELPFRGRENEYTWSISRAQSNSYLQSIYNSEQEDHKKLLKLFGIKGDSVSYKLNYSHDVTSMLLRVRGGAIDLLDGDLLEVTPDYNWRRSLNNKYVDFKRFIDGPSTFSMPDFSAILHYSKKGLHYRANLSGHFAEYYAATLEVIPEMQVYRLCKLWEYQDCELSKIECHINGEKIAEYHNPKYTE